MSEESNASQTGATGTGNGAGSGDVQKPTWIEQLPEDMRGDESLYGHKTIGDLVKAHKTTLSEREGLIRVPGEGATDKELADFRKAIGVPESADRYSFSKPDNLPEGIPYDTNLETAFKHFLHDKGVPDKVASDIHGWYHGLMVQGYEQQQKAEAAALEKAVNDLKDTWKGDEFRVNTELASRAFSKFGGDEAKAFIEGTKIGGLALGDHPMFLKVFASIGKAISEDSISSGREGGGNGEMSDEDKAKARFPKTKFPS